MMIPGLDICMPSENESEETTEIKFGNGTFSIPKSQIFGGCREVEKFEKKCCLKATTLWVFHKCTITDALEQKEVCVRKSKQLLNASVESRNEEIARTIREINIVRSLKHDNVMQFQETAVREALDSVYMVFECCDYFLSDLIDQKADGIFEKDMVKNIMQQIFQGLEYVHKNGIMHRDLTPKNLMFNEHGVLKIANFQNAAEWHARNKGLEVICKNYQAPEILLEANQHGPAVDIWAAGCILAELLLMKLIFPGSTVESIFAGILTLLGEPDDIIWQEYSSLPILKSFRIETTHRFNCLGLYFKKHTPQTTNFLREMISYNPDDRLSSNMCCVNPFFDEPPKALPLESVASMLKSSRVTNGLKAISVGKTGKSI